MNGFTRDGKTVPVGTVGVVLRLDAAADMTQQVLVVRDAKGDELARLALGNLAALDLARLLTMSVSMAGAIGAQESPGADGTVGELTIGLVTPHEPGTTPDWKGVLNG